MTMVEKETPGRWWYRGLGYLAVITLLLILGCVLYLLLGDWLELPRISLQRLLLWAALGWLVLLAFCPLYLWVWECLARSMAEHEAGEPRSAEATSRKKSAESEQRWVELRGYLRSHFGTLGFFWRHKVRLLLVVGEPDEIRAIAPTLADKQWLEGDGAVLLWGGSLQGGDDVLLEQWRKLCPRRPLDGIVWALSKLQSADPEHLGNAQHRLQAINRLLRWQAPVHLWEVRGCPWEQSPAAEAVGCRLAPRTSAAQLENSLRRLEQPLRGQGLAQMHEGYKRDFLLRLSRDLQAEGIARWKQAWVLLRSRRDIALRGLWFSLPLPAAQGGGKNDWRAHPAWQGVLGDKRLGGHPQGWTLPRIGAALVLGLAGLWCLGMLLSFASNRAQIADMQTTLAVLDQPREGDDQLRALSDLVHELDRLDHRAQHGTPWYQRFGLNQNDGLLAALWPRYVLANNRLMRDPAAANLKAELIDLNNLAPGDPERAERAKASYDQLKAYLMMSRPEKTDALFLTKTLTAAEPGRADITTGAWQGFAPNLWRFYAEHLAAHPEWRIEPDSTLIARTRQLLIGQIGQRNGISSLYLVVLDGVSSQYPPLGLQQMVGDTDAQTLFSTAAEVPGVFTRQAWEGRVRQAIDEAAEARREEIDWVLSDDHGQIAADLTPEALREQLTQRYFQDYSSAWLTVLNSLRWHQADSLADAIDQFTLMTDVRQSPLIALMNTLAYQGQAGSRTQALSDSLMQSAQKLIGQDKAPVIDQQAQGPKGPLDASFGPLLALLGKGAEPKGSDDSLSLQAFLTRMTRVRLKLQQVSTAPDPQAMTQALAQTVFQGKSVDLTDTQSYGSLMAASLGAEWSGFGQTLFVQPLEQAWRRVLQPSAAGLNGQWQRSVVQPWNTAFAGRYPFVSTGSDASLPMLGQMIRADTGRIDQFLSQQLGGVLRKEGNRWVADTAHSQGLRFNPDFLRAVNQLGALADVLYTDGGLGIGFDLMAKPVRNLVQTTFILDGNRLEYFNQMESWQRFDWPGASDHPGASLSWTSVKTGERLYGDYSGTWGLIRLLEQAQVTALDDGETRYRLQIKAPDGLELTWNLRTELGAGPLAMLQLRDFKLPERIFLSEGSAPVALLPPGDYP